MWELILKKENDQNKIEDYESVKYLLAIYNYHMYKILLIIKDINNNFPIVNLQEI